MQVSEARIAANRRNAQRSTGPNTDEGKARSRANALKHGLCSSVLVPEDAAVVQDRAEQIYQALKPYTRYQAWQVDQAAVIMVRLERAQRIERRCRDKVCLKAELTWDDDRRLEAEVLGGMLAKKPAEAVETLRRTPHGCEWLMGRWAMLAHAADTNPLQAWTAEQAAHAFDLLATPAIFREGRQPGASIDFEGQPLGPPEPPAAVARRMVAELKERREVVADLDEVARTLASVDLTNDDPELRRLRRYESALHSRLRWTLKQIEYQGPEGKPDPGLFPTWQVDAPPEERPEPKTEDEKAAEAHDPKSPHPPFCLTPDEFPPPGQKADIPAILRSRKQKQLDKATARREATLRKLDRRRA